MADVGEHDYPLWRLVHQLKSHDFVDLTHAFAPDIPHASDMPNEVRTALYDFTNDGFRTHHYQIVGQWGTHVDPPLHYIPEGRSLDEICVADMIMPLVVFDITDVAHVDPDYSVTVEDIMAWEQRFGTVPRGSFAALRSSWSSRWPSLEAMQNRDDEGIMHFPGWSVPALQFLCEERGICACGHETSDTDPGVLVSADEFPAETYILGQDRFQIEMIASLDRVPPAGAIAVVSFPKPAGGSGFPARIFAVVPHT